jgi:hypothetical protein
MIHRQPVDPADGLHRTQAGKRTGDAHFRPHRRGMRPIEIGLLITLAAWGRHRSPDAWRIGIQPGGSRYGSATTFFSNSVAISDFE